MNQGVPPDDPVPGDGNENLIDSSLGLGPQGWENASMGPEEKIDLSNYNYLIFKLIF